MNFGTNASKASAALRQQPATYLIAPNFSIPPASPTTKGPLDLGTLIADPLRCRPINSGVYNRVPIPEDQLYVSVIEDVSSSVTNSRGGEGGLFAKILDQSIGGDASLRGKRSSEDVFKIEKLETRYFYPSVGYVRACLQLPDVQDFNEMAEFKEPIYLITGLKIAWGATLTTSYGTEYEGKLEGGVAAPAGVVDLGVGGKAGLSRESVVKSSYGKPKDFVLGIQLQKVRYKKKTLFRKGGLMMEDMRKQPMLVDDDEWMPVVPGSRSIITLSPNDEAYDTGPDGSEYCDDIDLEELSDGELGEMRLIKEEGVDGRVESWYVLAEES